MSIYEKLLAIQAEIGPVKKDGTNPHFKSNYATLEQTWKALAPFCEKHGVLVMHRIIGREVMTEVMTMEEGGNILESAFPLPDLQDPQKVGSAITYGKRYNLCALFNLMTTDDDGELISTDYREPPKDKPKTKPKAKPEPEDAERKAKGIAMIQDLARNSAYLNGDKSIADAIYAIRGMKADIDTLSVGDLHAVLKELKTMETSWKGGDNE